VYGLIVNEVITKHMDKYRTRIMFVIYYALFASIGR